jgi:hypothetical protein
MTTNHYFVMASLSAGERQTLSRIERGSAAISGADADAAARQRM